MNKHNKIIQLFCFEVIKSTTTSDVRGDFETIIAGLTFCPDKSVNGNGVNTIVPLLYIFLF